MKEARVLFLTGNVKTKKISEMSGIFIQDIPSEHHKNYFRIPYGIFHRKVLEEVRFFSCNQQVKSNRIASKNHFNKCHT